MHLIPDHHGFGRMRATATRHGVAANRRPSCQQGYRRVLWRCIEDHLYGTASHGLGVRRSTVFQGVHEGQGSRTLTDRSAMDTGSVLLPEQRPTKLGMLRRTSLCMLLTSALAACVSTPPTSFYFKIPGLSLDQWSRIQKECAYEAEKATASADPKTAFEYTWRRIFIMCAELRGATFVGRVRISDEEWERLSASCEEEARNAAAGRPSSRERDEMKEDRKVECLRRNGVVFNRSLFP
jgi:hypothetical protein